MKDVNSGGPVEVGILGCTIKNEPDLTTMGFFFLPPLYFNRSLQTEDQNATDAAILHMTIFAVTSC